MTVLSSDHTMQTYVRWPIRVVEGKGCYVTDSDGDRYLDLLGGIAVAGVGHCHPRVVRAISEQAAKLIHVSNLYETEPQMLLAERLAALSGGMLSFFTNSGAESVECALKLARKWATAKKGPDAVEVIAMNGSFHGRTFGALSATGQPAKGAPFAPLVPSFTHVPFDDLQMLGAAMHREVAAVLVEPIQGEGGVVVPDDAYLQGVRTLCDRWESLLIVDEVQTGVGRTGTWFAHEDSGARPDVICLAKSLAGGLPMGACLAVPEVASAFSPGDHATTFGGGPVQAAAALAVLDTIETEGLLARALAAGARFEAGLSEIAPRGSEIRGRGLLVGVKLPHDNARSVSEAALGRGALVGEATASVLRLAPPLTITNEEIDRGLDILAEAFAAVEGDNPDEE